MFRFIDMARSKCVKIFLTLVLSINLLVPMQVSPVHSAGLAIEQGNPCWPPGSVGEGTYDGLRYVCECIQVKNVIFCRWIRDYTFDENERSQVNKLRNNSTYGHILLTAGAVDTSTDDSFFVSTMAHNPDGSPDIEGPGELRVRLLIQKLENGIWVTKYDSNYIYNTVSTSGMLVAFNMQAIPDWGAGPYRVQGTAQKMGSTFFGLSAISNAVDMDGELPPN